MNSEFSDYIKGKNVLLLGPAPYIKQKQYDFEDYDIICKINHTYRYDLGPKDRCDILYTSVYVDTSFGDHQWPWKSLEAKKLRLVYSPELKFQSVVHNKFLSQNVKIPWSVIDIEEYNELQKKIETRPNTGTLAIYDLLKCNFKNLHISGITMFVGKTTHSKEYRRKMFTFNEVSKFTNHNIKRQAQYLYPLMIKANILLDDEVHSGFKIAMEK